MTAPDKWRRGETRWHIVEIGDVEATVPVPPMGSAAYWLMVFLEGAAIYAPRRARQPSMANTREAVRENMRDGRWAADLDSLAEARESRCA